MPGDGNWKKISYFFVGVTGSTISQHSAGKFLGIGVYFLELQILPPPYTRLDIPGKKLAHVGPACCGALLEVGWPAERKKVEYVYCIYFYIYMYIYIYT